MVRGIAPFAAVPAPGGGTLRTAEASPMERTPVPAEIADEQEILPLETRRAA